jgi:hypothetical protein
MNYEVKFLHDAPASTLIRPTNSKHGTGGFCLELALAGRWPATLCSWFLQLGVVIGSCQFPPKYPVPACGMACRARRYSVGEALQFDKGCLHDDILLIRFWG